MHEHVNEWICVSVYIHMDLCMYKHTCRCALMCKQCLFMLLKINTKEVWFTLDLFNLILKIGIVHSKRFNNQHRSDIRCLFFPLSSLYSVCICINVCVFISTYVHTYVCMCMIVYMCSIHAYECVYVCVHTCTCV